MTVAGRPVRVIRRNPTTLYVLFLDTLTYDLIPRKEASR